jgi:hypothetical protein
MCFSVRHRESATSVEQHTMNNTASTIAGMTALAQQKTTKAVALPASAITTMFRSASPLSLIPCSNRCTNGRWHRMTIFAQWSVLRCNLSRAKRCSKEERAGRFRTWVQDNEMSRAE